MENISKVLESIEVYQRYKSTIGIAIESQNSTILPCMAVGHSRSDGSTSTIGVGVDTVPDSAYDAILGQHVTLGQMFNYVDLRETFVFSYAGDTAVWLFPSLVAIMFCFQHLVF